MGILDRFRRNEEEAPGEVTEVTDGAPPLDQAQSFGAKILPVFACGAGLFSDGYVNNVSAPALRVQSGHENRPGSVYNCEC
jgi:hypothetical protein